MPVKLTNNAYGTLTASISSVQTTITLNSAEGARFPSLTAGEYFYATLIDTSNNLEIVKVTARSADTLVVVRGQDGSTARAFSANDRFELRPVAALFAEYVKKTGDTVSGDLVVTGNVSTSGNNINIANNNTPSSASAPGTKGDIRWDTSYIYVCVATNTWKRSSLSTW
jgi:hypothetical protein